MEVHSPARYLKAYLCWAISVALTFVTLLTWRSSAMIILGLTPWDRYIEHAINQFGFLIMAIIGLIVIVFTEYFYRTGVEKNRLATRFFLVTLIQLIILTVAHLLRLWGSLLLDLPAGSTITFIIMELTLCSLCFWLYKRK